MTANGSLAAPAEYRFAIPAWLCSSSSIGRGQPCSTFPNFSQAKLTSLSESQYRLGSV